MSLNLFSEKILIKKILIFLFIIAAILRIASCGKYVFMDENRVFFNIFNFIKCRTWIPVFLTYPTLFSYLSTIPTYIGVVILCSIGMLSSPINIIDLAYLHSIFPYVPARLTSVAFGLATIFLLFKIGEKFFDRKIGLIAAAFLVFSKLHIHYSGYALPEVTMTFFATCSLLFSLSALTTKSIRDFILAGAFAGFAATTKYNGALTILPIISVYLIKLYDEKHIFYPSARLSRHIILAGLAFVYAFLIGSPGWLLHPHLFWQNLISAHAHMAMGHLGAFGIPYVRHLLLFWVWEKTIAVFFGLGVIYAILRHTRKDIVLLALVLPSFLYIGSWQKKDLHYLIFLYPALSLLSARLVFEILTKLSKRVLKISAFSVFIAIFIWPIYSTSMYAYKQTLEDNRWAAHRWVQNNIPEGSKIIVDWAYIPRLSIERRDPFEIINPYEIISLKYNPDWLTKIQADYLITSSACFNRFFSTRPPPSDNPLFDAYNKRKDAYVTLLHKTETIGWKLLKKFHSGKGPDILIYGRQK